MDDERITGLFFARDEAALSAASEKYGAAELVELTAEMELCIPDPRSEAGANESELSESINRFLAELPAEQRVIFLRRYWFADSIAEASQRLGIGESKVKTTLFRLRKRLRKHLESEGFNV